MLEMYLREDWSGLVGFLTCKAWWLVGNVTKGVTKRAVKAGMPAPILDATRSASP